LIYEKTWVETKNISVSHSTGEREGGAHIDILLVSTEPSSLEEVVKEEL